MKKAKVIYVAVLIAMSAFLLAGCGKSARGVTKWAQNLKVEDITIATVQAGFSDAEAISLSDVEIQKVVAIINSLEESDFVFNKDSFSIPPRISLSLTVGDTTYSINDALISYHHKIEIKFGRNLWWINCDELMELIVEKAGWIPEVVWDGSVSGSNISNRNSEYDVARFNEFQDSKNPSVLEMLTGNVDNISSVTISDADGRATQLDSPQSNNIIDTLSTVSAKEIHDFYSFEKNLTGKEYTITIEYVDSEADILYLKEKIIYFHPMSDKDARNSYLTFSVGEGNPLLTVLEEVLNKQ